MVTNQSMNFCSFFLAKRERLIQCRFREPKHDQNKTHGLCFPATARVTGIG